MNEVSLGKKLQAARKNEGLTQQELCQRASLSYSTLAKIERGAIKSPSIFTIQRIAAALKTTLNDLVGNIELADTIQKQSKSGVKFVYFDINGCLVRFYQRAFTEIAKQSGMPPDIIETAFWHHNNSICRGEIQMEEFNSILGKQFNLPEFDWRDYYLRAVEPIGEMHEVVKWAAQHYKIGLLSNIMPGLVNQMLKAKLVPNVKYDAIIDSSEVHVSKPESEIFEIAQAKTGFKPEQILFIDDSRTNVMAAEQLGWKVLWFDDFRTTESTERVRSALELA